MKNPQPSICSTTRQRGDGRGLSGCHKDHSQCQSIPNSHTHMTVFIHMSCYTPELHSISNTGAADRKRIREGCTRESSHWMSLGCHSTSAPNRKAHRQVNHRVIGNERLDPRRETPHYLTGGEARTRTGMLDERNPSFCATSDANCRPFVAAKEHLKLAAGALAA